LNFLQGKLAAAKAGGVIQPSLLSSNSKSDTLPMMTRGTYDRAESKLSRSGMSLENVIDKPRMSIKVMREGCQNYPNLVNAMIGGILRQVPYDMANSYACFEQYMTRQVTIAYTGGRLADYAAANVAAGLLATPANYTWHHFENYNNGTGRGTMQLVLTAAHQAVWHHGGVWQWEQANPGFYAA